MKKKYSFKKYFNKKIIYWIGVGIILVGLGYLAEDLNTPCTCENKTIELKFNDTEMNQKVNTLTQKVNILISKFEPEPNSTKLLNTPKQKRTPNLNIELDLTEFPNSTNKPLNITK